MNWETEDGAETVTSSRELARLVERLERGTSSFAVLSRGAGHYMQVAIVGDGFVIEKRSGGENTHVHARRSGRRSARKREEGGFFKRLFGSGGSRPASDTFRLEEVKAAFLAYYEDTPDPDFLQWAAGFS